jgi:tetratricopeptide (TPR) repeat protein
MKAMFSMQSKGMGVIMLLLLIFILSVLYPSPDKSWIFLFIIGAYVVASSWYLYKGRAAPGVPAPGLTDVSIIVILMYEIANFYLSAYRPNSFFYLEKFFSFIAFYFLLRLYVNREKIVDGLVFVLNAAGVILAVVNLKYFLSFHANNSNLANLYDFKNLYKPLGINSNELASIFLCFLSFPAYFLLKAKNRYARVFYTVSVTLLFFGILTTFSRGAYLALTFWLVAMSGSLYYFKVMKPGQVIRAALVFAAAIFIIAAPIFRPVVTTFSMDRTLSQKLSTEGRKELYRTGMKIFGSDPATGAGSNNFALKYAVFKRQSEDVRFNGNVTNSYLLLLIEKGIVGFVLYGTLLFIVFSGGVRKLISRGDDPSKGPLIVFLCSLSALLIREIFYASISTNDQVLFLFIILVYLCVYHSQGSLSVLQGFRGKAVYGLMLFLSLFILYPFIRRDIARAYYNSGVNAYAAGAYEKALSCFQEAGKYDGDNAIYQAYTALAMARNAGSTISIEDVLSDSYSFDAASNGWVDSSIQYYLRAFSLNEDDLFLHNTGWLYFVKGDSTKAQEYLKKAAAMDPNIALYHVSLGLMYEKSRYHEKALSEYSTAIRLSPDILDSDFFKSLKKRTPVVADSAMSYARQGLESFLTIKPDVKMQAKLAKIYLNSGREQEAYALLGSVTEKLPNLNRPYIYMGDIYGARGDRPKMLEYYWLGAKTDPTDFLGDVKLGNYYKACGDTTKAAELFKAGYYKWTTIFPEYSTKTAIIYRLKRSIQNAVFPQDMLQYIKSFNHQ